MMFKRLNEAATLCVLAVSRKVLALPGVVITDRNAAADYVRFLHPRHAEHIDFDDVFAKDWRHPGNVNRYL